MKNALLIFWALLFCPAMVFAQTDSTQTQYSEETAADSDFNLKETYNYLIRAQVEEKTLLKIGVYGFSLGGDGDGVKNGDFTYGLGIERKIKPAISVLGNFKHTTYINTPYFADFYTINVGARYYYNINARIRKGKSANNFSANYLSLQQENVMGKVNDDFRYGFNFNFLYGLQRRISKYGFVDFSFGPTMYYYAGKTRLDLLDLHFSIGLAF